MAVDENGNEIPEPEQVAEGSVEPVATEAAQPEQTPAAAEPTPEPAVTEETPQQEEQDAFALLHSLLQGHDQRLAALEGVAHNSHTISQDVIDQIALQAVQTLNTRLKAALGQ